MLCCVELCSAVLCRPGCRGLLLAGDSSRPLRYNMGLGAGICARLAPQEVQQVAPTAREGPKKPQTRRHEQFGAECRPVANASEIKTRRFICCARVCICSDLRVCLGAFCSLRAPLPALLKSPELGVSGGCWLECKRRAESESGAERNRAEPSQLL